MKFFAVIERDGLLVPVVRGGDGPDAECLATWDSERTAREESGDVLLAQAYPVHVFNLDDAL